MTNNSAQYSDIDLLEKKLQEAWLPEELKQKALAQVDRLNRMAQSQTYSQQYDDTARYVEWIGSVPWNKKSLDPVSLDNAKKVLDSTH